MPLPKYMTELHQKQQDKHKKSKKQELRLANELRGERQKGSGSQAFHKGDVKTTELLVESKRTEKDSLSVKKAWLIKISREAVGYNKIPALSLEFDTMPDMVAKDWVAIPSRTLALLIDCYKVLEAQSVSTSAGATDPDS